MMHKSDTVKNPIYTFHIQVKLGKKKRTYIKVSNHAKFQVEQASND